MGSFLKLLREIDPESHGKTASELVELAKAEGNVELRELVESLAGKLEARNLGNKLRSNRKRIFNGLFLDHAGERMRAIRWAAFDAEAFSQVRKDSQHSRHSLFGSECRECCESLPTLGKTAGVEVGPYAERH
jgi:hypothetical protein